MVDAMLADTVSQLLQNVFVMIGIVVLSAVAVPYFIAIFLLLLWMFQKIRVYFMQLSRDLKRRELLQNLDLFCFGVCLIPLLGPDEIGLELTISCACREQHNNGRVRTIFVLF